MQLETIPLFGRIAVEAQMVTLEQVQACLELQRKCAAESGQAPHLGKLLLQAGLVTPDQVRQVLALQKRATDGQSSRANVHRAEIADAPPPGNDPPTTEDNTPAAPAGKENEEVTYQPGEVIFREGDAEPLDMFVLRKGVVRISRAGITLGRLDKRGSFVGESSALLKVPHLTTAEAESACALWRIPQDQLRMFFATKPALSLSLSEWLAKRLADATIDFVSAQAKVAELASRSAADEAKPTESEHTTDPVDPPACDEADSPSQDDSEPSPQAPSPEATSQTPGLLGLNHEAVIVADASGALTLKDVLNPKRTFVNGFPVEEPRELKDNDCIQIDRYMFQFFLEHPNLIGIEEEAQAEDAEIDNADDDAGEASTEANGKPDPGPQDGEASADDGASEPSDAATSEPSAGPAPSDLLGSEAPTVEAVLEIAQNLPDDSLPEEMASLAQRRIEFYLQLAELDEKRKEIEADPECSDDVKREISRQRREMDKIPNRETLNNSLAKFQSKLAPPEDDSRPPLDEGMRTALELAVEQVNILLKRDDSTAEVLRACATIATDEPLYRIGDKLGIPLDNLFGWTGYALALEQYRDEQEGVLKELSTQLDALTGDKKSKKGADDAEVEAIKDREREHRNLKLFAGKELKSIERDMVEEFWAVYEKFGLALVAGIAPADEPFIRGLLRWGMIGCSPRLLESEVRDKILAECADKLPQPTYGRDGTHVLYSDEIIEFAAKGFIPNAANEDLELNHANTPLWKADRSWRRMVNYRIQEELLREILAETEAAVAEEAKAVEETEKRIKLVNPKDEDHKKQVSALRAEMQEHKVEGTRKERLAEMLKDNRIPRIVEKKETAAKGLVESGVEVSAADRAKHEITCIRQNSRLVAKLSEPFLPFVLRDSYKPERGDVNDRTTILEALAEAERLDPLLFSEPLVAGAKKRHRVLVRQAPIIAVAPAPGVMGMILAPRGDADNGAFVIPGYFTRPGMREEVLWDILSDYRFDTSKASAGVDVMNSDTLVAAYAEFRWMLRKKDRQVRQKAGIFTEENDRTNWRRHYAIYMKSAEEAGKQLFYKAPDLYERIIGKFIELPEGLEVLKRG